ncbi:MAG TPA: hypothetical protein VGY99_14755 [Candidatus Binataceae bacterium]|jgi:hypothetical protein|nr:hypothetical protein [Candidatus Binataceae bacterium]
MIASVMHEKIEIGYQVFIDDKPEEIGAVRQAPSGGRGELVIYVENAGDFVVSPDAVKAVQFQKVILHYAQLEPRLKAAIRHAHDAEEPGA